MILSQTSEYAIRAVSCIAINQEFGPVRAKDLSVETAIPLTYLSKVLRKLVEAEILTSTKGHNGGFLLARPPKKIKLYQVLEAMEFSVAKQHCIFGWRMCNSKKPCLLHHRWSEVKDTFQKWIHTTSLEDIQKDARAVDWLTGFGADKLKDQPDDA